MTSSSYGSESSGIYGLTPSVDLCGIYSPTGNGTNTQEKPATTATTDTKQGGKK